MRATRKGEIQDRFWSRVSKDGPNGCWQWTGTVNHTAGGYGTIQGALMGKRYVPKGHPMLAHRVSWIIHNGDIPDHPSYHGMVVMHRCDNRLCVNPAHLMLGTQADNHRDMREKGRGITPEMEGCEHARACFTDPSTVTAIRSSPLGSRKLARIYGVNKSTILRLKRGDTYASV